MGFAAFNPSYELSPLRGATYSSEQISGYLLRVVRCAPNDAVSRQIESHKDFGNQWLDADGDEIAYIRANLGSL
jgi:hypothetical protein